MTLRKNLNKIKIITATLLSAAIIIASSGTVSARQYVGMLDTVRYEGENIITEDIYLTEVIVRPNNTKTYRHEVVEIIQYPDGTEEPTGNTRIWERDEHYEYFYHQQCGTPITNITIPVKTYRVNPDGSKELIRKNDQGRVRVKGSWREFGYAWTEEWEKQNPLPEDPTPSNPTPSNPTPSQPSQPSNPTPSNPTPSNPTPSQPSENTNKPSQPAETKDKVKVTVSAIKDSTDPAGLGRRVYAHLSINKESDNIHWFAAGISESKDDVPNLLTLDRLELHPDFILTKDTNRTLYLHYKAITKAGNEETGVIKFNTKELMEEHIEEFAQYLAEQEESDIDSQLEQLELKDGIEIPNRLWNRFFTQIIKLTAKMLARVG